MKLNKKGFMMAEVIVMSAVILGVLMSIYTTYNKLFIRYKEVLDYYNVDGVYKLSAMRDEMINSIDDKNINTVISSIDRKGYYEYSNGVYIVRKDAINNLKAANITSTFKDYLQYLKDSTIYKTTGNYIMVIEWNKSIDSYYYNYLELEV